MTVSIIIVPIQETLNSIGRKCPRKRRYNQTGDYTWTL